MYIKRRHDADYDDETFITSRESCEKQSTGERAPTQITGVIVQWVRWEMAVDVKWNGKLNLRHLMAVDNRQTESVWRLDAKPLRKRCNTRSDDEAQR